MAELRPSVLVTGSSRGIGRAIAVHLARNGYDLVVHCRSDMDGARQTRELAQAAGAAVRIIQFDQRERAATRQALEEDIEANGVYYAVVLNSGIARDAAFPMLDDDDWDQVMRTNLDGFFNVLQPVIMPMIRTRQPGRIVTLSSVSGLVGNRGQVNYSASKAGIIGATKALATELAKRRITVNCVAPGLIETDMTRDVPPEMLNYIPMGRMGQPDEVAGLVRFLLSAEAAYITRQVISVNGGMA